MSSSTSVPSFIPTTGGKFTFANGSGGPDVGSFNTSLTVAPTLVWTNMSSVGPNISSSAPPTLTWTGGDTSGYVIIQWVVGAASGRIGFSITTFSCTVPQSALQFTIPQWVMLAMPPSSTLSGIPLGSLGIQAWSPLQKFTAPNIDVSYIGWYMGSSKTVAYTP